MRGLPESNMSSDAGSSAGAAPPVKKPSLHGRSSLTNNFGSKNHSDEKALKGNVKDVDTTRAWRTKAGKKRERRRLACIACHCKKLRCSGEELCSHCSRSRIPCVYKATVRTAATRKSYMKMSEEQLKRMERRISIVVPESDQKSTPSLTPTAAKPAIMRTVPESKISSRNGDAEEDFGPNPEAWARRTTGSSLGLGCGLLPGAGDSEDSQLLQEGSESLPSMNIQEHLSQVYFANIYGQAYHLLNKSSYMERLRSNNLPPVLILSVCAVAARFSTDPHLDSPTGQNEQFLRGEEWAGPARDICTRRCESPNMTILICLLILGLHEFGTCQGGRSWALGGQAIGMAYALQLHKHVDQGPISHDEDRELSSMNRELRRQIMCSCFIMDRFMSLGTGRPTFINEDDITFPIQQSHFQFAMPAVTATPSREVLADRPSVSNSGGNSRDSIDAAALLVRLVALWGRITAHVNHSGKVADSKTTFAKLWEEAQCLLSSIPEPSLSSHRTTNQFILLHMIAQHCILLLSRASLRPASGQLDDFTKASRSRACEAAHKISELIKAAEDNDVSLRAPFAAYCAFTSTIMHIHGTLSSNLTKKAIAEVNYEINLKFLRKMMKYWGVFHWMGEQICFYRKTLEHGGSESAADENSIMSPILPNGDWLNHYPDGISDKKSMVPSRKIKDKGADGVLAQKAELQTVGCFLTTLTSAQPPIGQGTTGQPSRRQEPQAGQSIQPTPSLERHAAVPEQQMTPTERPPPAEPLTKNPLSSVLPQTFQPSVPRVSETMPLLGTNWIMDLGIYETPHDSSLLTPPPTVPYDVSPCTSGQLSTELSIICAGYGWEWGSACFDAGLQNPGAIFQVQLPSLEDRSTTMVNSVHDRVPSFGLTSGPYDGLQMHFGDFGVTHVFPGTWSSDTSMVSNFCCPVSVSTGREWFQGANSQPKTFEAFGPQDLRTGLDSERLQVFDEPSHYGLALTTATKDHPKATTHGPSADPFSNDLEGDFLGMLKGATRKEFE